tara:strand:+ start:247 stop:378 length:132 start_codon:yes stop_codon:yes gene_type:complete
MILKFSTFSDLAITSLFSSTGKVGGIQQKVTVQQVKSSGKSGI